MKFIEHSDDWSWAPPIPFKHWVGWWISNDDGDAMHGPFETKAEAEEELAEIESDMHPAASPLSALERNRP